jgi:CBS domain containing-hemolysin-like protein
MQRELIHNIFDLDERTAEELTTSRGRVETLDVSASTDEVIERISASPRSRYPVVDGDLDHVVGLIHIKDFIRAKHEGSPLGLRHLVRPLLTVAATATAEQLLDRFKRDRTHASPVVDEFGSTLGLVTLDDIIAEVMHEEVADESKQPVRHDDGSLSLDGETTLAELKDDHRLVFEHPEVVTLAGLILAEHGTVPEVGVTVTVQGHQLTVDKVEGRKIARVRVRPRP